MRERDHRPGRRDPLREPREDLLLGDGRQLKVVVLGKRRDHSQPTTSCWRSVTAPATPFGCCIARGVCIEAKPFSIGFRIEHPQSLIDRARLGRNAGHPQLGAADYKLVHHAGQWPLGLQFLHVPRRHGRRRDVRAEARGHQRHEPVFAQGAQRQCRASSWASRPEQDYPGDALAGVELQEQLRVARLSNSAAATIARRANWSGTSCGRSLDANSAQSSRPTRPGSVWATCPRPCRLTRSWRSAKRCRRSATDHGFDGDDAVLTGVETRTSSPVRIARAHETLQSLNLRGLYPAGEGAGYAGGILSAGVDGIKVAEAVARSMLTGTTLAAV